MQKGLNIVIGIFIVISILILGIEAKQEISANVVQDTKIDTVITIEHGNFDVGSKEKGTIMINMDSNYYNQMISDKQDKNVKSLVFFSSRIMPGLEIRYNIEEQVFEAGIPTFKSSHVELLNGQQHMLAFTYELGSNQAIFFDGKEIGHRPYVSVQGNLLAGFTIKNYGRPYEIIDNSLVSKIEIKDYAMSEEELLR